MNFFLVTVTAKAAEHAPAAPAQVEVRLEMSWLTAASHLREATVVLEPLAPKGVPQTIRLVESITSIATLAAGRYQLTTTTPLVVDGQAYGWSIELPLLEQVNTVRLTQENAVRLRLGDLVVPSTTGIQAVALSSTATKIDPEAHAQIMALLNRWAAAIRSHNLNGLMSCYAPHLVTYLEQTNLSRQQVHAENQKLFRVYDHVNRFDLGAVDLNVGETRANASAVKTWNFSNDDASWHGRAQVYFEFSRTKSGWVITSERERLIPERELPTQQSASNLH